MPSATLTQDVIAEDSYGDTRIFPKGRHIDVEDWDDNWFMFFEDGDEFNSDEKPGLVLSFDDDEHNQDAQEHINVKKYPVTTDDAYKPVPNMTPLNRKYLLL